MLPRLGQREGDARPHPRNAWLLMGFREIAPDVHHGDKKRPGAQFSGAVSSAPQNEPARAGGSKVGSGAMPAR